MNPVATYCERWEKAKKLGKTPEEFARFAIVYYKSLCLEVLEIIGSWPSSEPELAALQKAYR